MANTLLTDKVLASSILAHLENDLVLANNCHTDYSKDFAHKGDTIDVERPQRFVGQSDNLDITSYSEDLNGGKIPLQLNKTETIAYEISALEMTLDVRSDHIQKKYVKPAVTQLKSRIEEELFKECNRSFYNFTGTPGTTPSTFLALADADAVLTEMAVPDDMRYGYHSPRTSAVLADTLKNVFNEKKVKTALDQAKIGGYGGLTNNFKTNYTRMHTCGAQGGTPLIQGSGQDVTYEASKDTLTQTLIIDSAGVGVADWALEGDIFTIADVYSVNPITRDSTGRLQTFVVKANASSDGTAKVTLTISPPMITSGAFQTVTQAPADNAAITLKTGAAGSQHQQSLIMHPHAVSLITRPLIIENGGSFTTTTVNGNKVSISCSKGGDFKTLKSLWRFDMLFDVKAMNPSYGLRLTN